MKGKTLQDSSSLENSSALSMLSDKESNELTSVGGPSVFATFCVFWILSNDEYDREKLWYGCTMISLPWVTPGFASALDVPSVLDSQSCVQEEQLERDESEPGVLEPALTV